MASRRHSYRCVLAVLARRQGWMRLTQVMDLAGFCAGTTWEALTEGMAEGLIEQSPAGWRLRHDVAVSEGGLVGRVRWL